jgi:hypothetical protein
MAGLRDLRPGSFTPHSYTRARVYVSLVKLADAVVSRKCATRLSSLLYGRQTHTMHPPQSAFSTFTVSHRKKGTHRCKRK